MGTVFILSHLIKSKALISSRPRVLSQEDPADLPGNAVWEVLPRGHAACQGAAPTPSTSQNA